jgi:Protein of unknown function (DUF1822)
MPKNFVFILRNKYKEKKMSNFSVSSSDFRLLLPEVIWLEPEHFEQTREISDRIDSEEFQWQTYLNVLGQLGFKEWLEERISNSNLRIKLSNINTIQPLSYLEVGDFKLGIITTENLLTEFINLPKDVIEEPELVAHFYVLLQVVEEQGQVIVKGFLRLDQLRTKGDCYQIPISELDIELNHLLFYFRYLESKAIALSTTSIKSGEDKLLGYLSEARTKLSKWLEGFWDKEWQTIKNLVNLEASLNFSTRNALRLSSENASVPVAGGKIINLGMQLKEQSVALLVIVTPELENKLGILVRLLPTGGKKFLSPNLKLTLLSKTGENIHEVYSRSQDNYIQLKPFRGELGKQFSIQVSLSDVSIKEDFEL